MAARLRRAPSTLASPRIPMKAFRLACGTSLLLVMGFVRIAAADTPLTSIPLAAGLSAPLSVCSPPGDLHRIFIVEQTGQITIVKDGTRLPTPFVDLSSHMLVGGELGLLGLAFHPNYASNGLFF